MAAIQNNNIPAKDKRITYTPEQLLDIRDRLTPDQVQQIAIDLDIRHVNSIEKCILD